MLHRESRARRRRHRIGAPLAGSVLIVALFVGYLMAAGQSTWDGIARMVRDINPGEAGSYPYSLVEAGGKVFFVADDGSYGTELWASDGTSSGTQRLTDIAPSAAGASIANLTNAQGTLYFVARADARVLQLWRSDGTRAGTRRVKSFDPGSDMVYMHELIAVGPTVYFTMMRAEATTLAKHSSLWRSDGTEQGTTVVADIEAEKLTDVQGTLFFVTATSASGVELWKIGGTPAGVEMVADISPGPTGSYPQLLTNVNGTLFFVADDGSFEDGRELWKSDGTARGTVRVKDIYPGDASSNPTFLTAVDGSLFFTAFSPDSGRELWRSDGSAAGTMLVRDIVVGEQSSALHNLTNVDGVLFFLTGLYPYPSGPYYAPDIAALWRSDGTSAGTSRLGAVTYGYSRRVDQPMSPQQRASGEQLSPDQADPLEWKIVGAGGGLFIRFGPLLWRSDTTDHPIPLIYSGVGYDAEQLFGQLMSAGAFVFFNSGDALHGNELWAVPVDPKLYVRFPAYLPVIRDSRPTPTYGYPDPYPFPQFPTATPWVTATPTPTPNQ